MKYLAVLAFASALLSGCATMKPEAAGTLTVDCNVPEAAVMLDEAVIGSAGELHKKGKLLAPGFYRVELRHPSYYSHFAEVDVPEGGAAVVKAELRPVLD